jgi:hypothetical protein
VPLTCQREHVLARVDARHRTQCSDCRRHLAGEEAGPGADVQDTLAKLQRQRADDNAALLDDIRGDVSGFDPA